MCYLRLRQPGRRGQPQRRPHGHPARRPARQRARRHHQPPLRLGPRCRRHRRPRHPRRRGRPDARRRRREHDPRALRHGQGRRSLLPRRRDLRHHDRLALRQPADEGAVRRRFHAGDRRERRRGIPGLARRPGRLRAAAASRRRKAAQDAGFFAREIAPVTIKGRKGDTVVDTRRAPAPRHHAGEARQAEDAVPQPAARSPPATPPA